MKQSETNSVRVLKEGGCTVVWVETDRFFVNRRRWQASSIWRVFFGLEHNVGYESKAVATATSGSGKWCRARATEALVHHVRTCREGVFLFLCTRDATWMFQRQPRGTRETGIDHTQQRSVMELAQFDGRPQPDFQMIATGFADLGEQFGRCANLPTVDQGGRLLAAVDAVRQLVEGIDRRLARMEVRTRAR